MYGTRDLSSDCPECFDFVSWRSFESELFDRSWILGNEFLGFLIAPARTLRKLNFRVGRSGFDLLKVLYMR